MTRCWPRWPARWLPGAATARRWRARSGPNALARWAPVTLNRLELSRPAPTRHTRLAADPAAIEALFVDLFLDAHRTAPEQIILDLDATDDPLHGQQEGRFFHGYYDCCCYLPLYVFCGRHLLAAKLRRSNIDASAGAVEEVARIVGLIRARWPKVRILLRADSGFAREALMAWCENNRVDYLFGLARNARLGAATEAELQEARSEAEATGKPARRFRDFTWRTLRSWSRARRVIGKAEWTAGAANPRLVVTALGADEANQPGPSGLGTPPAPLAGRGRGKRQPKDSPTPPRFAAPAPRACPHGWPARQSLRAPSAPPAWRRGCSRC